MHDDAMPVETSEHDDAMPAETSERTQRGRVKRKASEGGRGRHDGGRPQRRGGTYCALCGWDCRRGGGDESTTTAAASVTTAGQAVVDGTALTGLGVRACEEGSATGQAGKPICPASHA